MKSTRTKSGALNAKTKTSEKFPRSAKKKIKYIESSESEDKANPDRNSDNKSDNDSSNTDIKEMVSMIVKGFEKMKYRKSGSTSRKASGDKKTERFKKKDNMENKSGKFDKAKVKCYKCEGTGHFPTECMKAKSRRSKALILEKKYWMDSSDSNEEVNNALMANVEINYN